MSGGGGMSGNVRLPGPILSSNCRVGPEDSAGRCRKGRSTGLPSEPALTLRGGGGRCRGRGKVRSDVMSKPVILTVDDEPDVLSAIERDLYAHFRTSYRIVK